MAKMLKRLGIGSKKSSPHPPKPDYCSHKSNSVQDLCGNLSTTDRKGRSQTLSSSSSNIHGHHSFDGTDSPKHTRSLRKSGSSRSHIERHTHAKSAVLDESPRLCKPDAEIPLRVSGSVVRVYSCSTSMIYGVLGKCKH